METYWLICHPDTPARTVESISVECEPVADGLWLRFHCELVLEELILPDPAEPDRADDLWRSTCFEAFVREGEGPAYREFNFSPSSRWAAYRFDDYRSGMAELELSVAPKIGLDASEGHFALETVVPLFGEDGDFALSAVIEETGGHKSYWALAHPPGQPDFHHLTCFAARLPAPSKS